MEKILKVLMECGEDIDFYLCEKVSLWKILSRN